MCEPLKAILLVMIQNPRATGSIGLENILCMTVKQNVIFNQDDTNTHNDTAIIYGEVLSEGEKEKVI